MIYRGSKDGFKAEDFHRSCDGKGKTVALIKTKARRKYSHEKWIKRKIRTSGFYTDINWTSDRGFKSGSGNSFIFVLNKEKEFIKLRCTNKQREVYHYKDRLCSFGTSDLWIMNDCNINYLN